MGDLKRGLFWGPQMLGVHVWKSIFNYMRHLPWQWEKPNVAHTQNFFFFGASVIKLKINSNDFLV